VQSTRDLQIFELRKDDVAPGLFGQKYKLKVVADVTLLVPS